MSIESWLIITKLANVAQVTTPAERISNFTAFGAADANSYYLYVVNDNPAARRLSVSLAKWKNVPTGGICIINQACTSGCAIRRPSKTD